MDRSSARRHPEPDLSSLASQLANTVQAGLDDTLAVAAPTATDGSASVSAPAVRTPFVHGQERYDVIGVIGQGGMGRVLEANDRQFGRVVALKELHGDVSSAAMVQRFVVESLVTGNLEHPGIPAVYERGVRDGKPFYTMRRLRGRTLHDAILDAKTLAERLKLLPVLVQVANTLGFAHERGVVHRDIKPENIIVGRHGETVVLDWGIAKVRSMASSAEPVLPSNAAPADNGPLTMHGSVLGTPAYMAPEQAGGRVEEIDERTDVFALGAILYQLLSGHAPYRGNTATMLSDALEVRFEPLGQAAAKAPTALRAICEKSMAKLPAERYRSATELAEALETFQTSAFMGGESRLIGLAANLISATAVFMLAATAVAMTHIASSFHEQGRGAQAVAMLSVFGIALSLVEWRTRGRYVLAPLAISIAIATALVGVTNTATGIGETLQYARNAAVGPDGPSLSRIVMQGVFESLGSTVTGGMMTALQVVLWGIARRAVARSNAAHERG